MSYFIIWWDEFSLDMDISCVKDEIWEVFCVCVCVF